MKQKLFSSMLCIICIGILQTNAQVTNLTNTSTIAVEYLGWNANPGSNSENLDLKNNFATRDITFFTNQTGVNGTSVQRMVIRGSGVGAGFVGIGLGAPAYQLDVQDNINVNTTGFLNGYRINGFTVLQTPGQENIFVGRGSGANFTGATLGENTFVGFNAGGSYITSGSIQGDRNTFVGKAAGFALTNGRHNTMVGCGSASD